MRIKFIFALLFITTHIYAAYLPQTEISGTVKVNIVSGTVAVDTTGLATETTLSSVDSQLADILVNTQSLDTKTPSLGQALSAFSMPVVLPAAQISALSPLSSVTANAGTNLNTSLLALDSTVAKDSSLSTLNTSVNTLLKPASTLSAVTTVGTITNPVTVNSHAVTNAGTFAVQVTSGTIALGSGSAAIGAVTVTNATATNLKAQAEAYQGGTAVGSANPMFISIAGVSTATALPVSFSAASFSLAGVSTTNYLNVSGTPLSIVADSILAQGSTTSGQKGSLTLGAVTTENPSYTTAQSNPLSIMSNGYLRVSAVPSGTTTVAGTVTANISGSIANTTFASTQSGVWGNSITGVSTTGILAVSATGNSTVNQGTSPWVSSISNQPFVSIGAVSTTGVLNTSSVLTAGSALIGQVSIGGVSTTGIFNSSILGVSTTSALNVANATATNLKTASEQYQGGVAISSSNPMFMSLAGVSTTGILSVSATNMAPDFSATATVSAADASTTAFAAKVANTARTGLEILNNTDATCFVRLSSTAATSSTATVVLLPNSGYYNMPKPIYTGQVGVVCSANGTTGKVLTTEKP